MITLGSSYGEKETNIQNILELIRKENTCISWVHTVLLNLKIRLKTFHQWLACWLAPCRCTKKLAIFKFSRRLKLTSNSRAAGGPHSLFNSYGHDNQQARKLAWPLRPSTACAPYSTGVIAALPVNHRVGLSLESLILKIRSRRSLWGKLLSSMIRLRLNVTIK